MYILRVLNSKLISKKCQDEASALGPSSEVEKVCGVAGKDLPDLEV